MLIRVLGGQSISQFSRHLSWATPALVLTVERSRASCSGADTQRPGRAETRTRGCITCTISRSIEPIGEADNRHRRATTLPRAVERLMLLDAILADRNLSWLATEREKVNHFTLNMRVAPADLPHVTFRRDDSETVRYFPDKLPIAVADDRQTHTFVYLMTRDLPVDFRSWLERHAELFRALPAWTVRLLVPRHLQRAIPAFKTAFREQLATPVRPVVLEEMRWYFHARRTETNFTRNDSITQHARSAHLDFGCCIAPGSTAASPCSTRRCRPFSPMRSGEGRGCWTAMSCPTVINISCPWQALRDRAPMVGRGKRGEKSHRGCSSPWDPSNGGNDRRRSRVVDAYRRS